MYNSRRPTDLNAGELLLLPTAKSHYLGTALANYIISATEMLKKICFNTLVEVIYACF